MRWFVLSLAGVAWLVLMPRDAFGEAPAAGPGRALTPVEVIGALFLALAWLALIARIVQRFDVWRRDQACVALFVLTLAAAGAALAGALVWNPTWIVLGLVAKVAAQVALVLRIDRLRAGLRLGIPGDRADLRGTPPAP